MKKALPILLAVFLLAVPAVALAASCDPTLKPLQDAGLFQGNQYCSANSLLIAVVKLLLGVAAMVAVLFIVIGGFRYITSNDEKGTGAAKKTLTNALIGLVIIILAYTIVAVVINAVGTSLNNNNSNSTTPTPTPVTNNLNPTPTLDPNSIQPDPNSKFPWDPSSPNGMQPN